MYSIKESEKNYTIRWRILLCRSKTNKLLGNPELVINNVDLYKVVILSVFPCPLNNFNGQSSHNNSKEVTRGYRDEMPLARKVDRSMVEQGLAMFSILWCGKIRLGLT